MWFEMLMCSSFPDDVLGAGAEPKGETNEKLIYNQLMTLRQANESEPNLGSRFWH